MEVILKRLSGRDHPLIIQAGDSVLRIKQRYEKEHGGPPSRQIMVCEGRELKNDKFVEDYSLHEGSIIHILVGPRWWRHYSEEEE